MKIVTISPRSEHDFIAVVKISLDPVLVTFGEKFFDNWKLFLKKVAYILEK